MRPLVCLASALSLIAFTPSSGFSQAVKTTNAPKKVIYRRLGDPTDTARKRSAGSARLDASKSSAVKTVRDSSGHIAKIFEPDAAGKLSIETDFEYNGAGKISAIRQLGNNGKALRTRTFEYDSNGVLTSQTSPEQGETRFTLDNHNQIRSTTDARAITKNSSYDQRLRLTTKSYSDGSATKHFRYWTKKRPFFLAYSGDLGGANLQNLQRYNKAGALDGTLQKYSDNTHASARFEYGAAGHITKITYPDNREVRQVWNRKGQLVSIKQGAISYFGDTRYSGSNGLLSARLGSDLTVTKGYEPSGRLSELSIGKGGKFYQATGTITTNPAASTGLKI